MIIQMRFRDESVRVDSVTNSILLTNFRKWYKAFIIPCLKNPQAKQKTPIKWLRASMTFSWCTVGVHQFLCRWEDLQSSWRNSMLSLDKDPRILGLKVYASDHVPVHGVRAHWFECQHGIVFSADFFPPPFVIRIQRQMYWGIISEVASLLEVEGSVWLSRLKNWGEKQRNLLSRHILPLSNSLFYWYSCESGSAMWVLLSNQHRQVWMKCCQKLIGAPLFVIT